MDGLPLASTPKHVPHSVGDGPIGHPRPAAPLAGVVPLFRQVLLELPPQRSRKTEVVHFALCGSLAHGAHLLREWWLLASPFSERCAFVQCSWRSSRIESKPSSNHISGAKPIAFVITASFA